MAGAGAGAEVGAGGAGAGAGAVAGAGAGAGAGAVAGAGALGGLQQSNNCALLSLNLPYNYNIDVAGACAWQGSINWFAVDVQTTISCDAFDSPHLYSDDDQVLHWQHYAIPTRSPSVPHFSSTQELRPVPVAMCASSQ